MILHFIVSMIVLIGIFLIFKYSKDKIVIKVFIVLSMMLMVLYFMLYGKFIETIIYIISTFILLQNICPKKRIKLN